MFEVGIGRWWVGILAAMATNSSSSISISKNRNVAKWKQVVKSVLGKGGGEKGREGVQANVKTRVGGYGGQPAKSLCQTHSLPTER